MSFTKSNTIRCVCCDRTNSRNPESDSLSFVDLGQGPVDFIDLMDGTGGYICDPCNSSTELALQEFEQDDDEFLLLDEIGGENQV